MSPLLHRIKHHVRKAWTELGDMLAPFQHAAHITRYRAELTAARARSVALVFAVLTPLWIFVDAYAFPTDVWIDLAALRMVSSTIFLTIAMWRPQPSGRWLPSLLPLYMLLAVPPAFYIAANQVLTGLPSDGIAGVVTDTYGMVPLLIVAGLCLFPLTAVEVLLLALPAVALVIFWAGPSASPSAASWESRADTVWLMLLLVGVALASSGSQLRHMMILMHKASHDALTGAQTRRAGEDALRSYFAAAQETRGLAVAFIDIDDFKAINDAYGHDVGDQVLRMAADAIRKVVRPTDTLIRWGGEEFLLVLPGTDQDATRKVAQRIMAAGLGTRPDGRPLTASIGLANVQTDPAVSWAALVELADSRMYSAKKAGKNRYVAA